MQVLKTLADIWTPSSVLIITQEMVFMFVISVVTPTDSLPTWKRMLRSTILRSQSELSIVLTVERLVKAEMR